MDFIRRNAKRIAIDFAGYFLILLAILTGWLPGPGGIPLAIAGLGLLSINNEWAKRLRIYLLKHGGELVKVLFPAHPVVQLFYDLLVFVLLVYVGWLIHLHEELWEIGLAIGLFFIAIFLAAMNRDRYKSLRLHKHKH